MKNIFRILMAVAVLFTASCAKEDISSSIVGGGEVEMTFTVDLPELGTRAYGDGTKANTLRYYVYDGDNYLPQISSESLLNKKVTLDNGKATVTLPLLKGITYNIIFWADKDGCYSINTDNKTVTVDYTGAYANDDNRDAFYKHLTDVDPTDAEKIKNQTNVLLTRPFGQLNVATSDYDAVVKNEVALTTSALTVRANTILDLTTGFGSEPQTFSFEATAIPTEDLPNKTGYKYLSMNYLIPGNVDAVFTFKGKRRSDNSEVTFTGTTYTNVPLKSNYRTNILGALLTKPTEFNVEILPGFGGEEEYDVEDIHVATAQQLQEAVAAVAATGGEIVLVDDINLSEILVITSTQASRTANAEDKVITLDGNGQKLISTAGRAINVSGAENVIIKNLTIECSGERAINVINNAQNVTIENVTATAANYTVNVAGSAPNAVVAIKNSTLNGLCTVNVAGAGAQVTLDGCKVYCNDNNTTAGESYAALCLNKNAVGGSIIATNTTVNVTEDSDSTKGRNGAEDGTVTIDGSTEGVEVMVAAITYPGSDYYHAFATLEAAIEFAKAGDTIQLIRDITLSEAVVGDTMAALSITEQDVKINLNGKTLKAGKSDRQRLLYIGTDANVTIENGKLEIISTNGNVDGTNTSTGGSSAVYCNGGNISMKNVKIIGSQRGGHRAVEVYDGVGEFNNVTIDVKYGLGINAGAGANVTINECNITVTGMYSTPYNSTCFSVMGGGEMVVNSGNYKLINNNTYPTGDTHGGWVGIIMSSGGTLTLNGGTFTNIPTQGFVPNYERPLFTCDAAAGKTATMNFNGGVYTPQEDQIAHKGGSGGTEVVKFKDVVLPDYYVNNQLLAKMTNNGNGSWTID